MKLRQESGAPESSPTPKRCCVAALWSLWALGLLLQIVGFVPALPDKAGFRARLYAVRRLQQMQRGA